MLEKFQDVSFAPDLSFQWSYYASALKHWEEGEWNPLEWTRRTDDFESPSELLRHHGPWAQPHTPNPDFPQEDVGALLVGKEDGSGKQTRDIPNF